MRRLGIANLILIGMIVCIVACFGFQAGDEEDFPLLSRSEPKELPKSPFSEFDDFFQEIGESAWALRWVSPQMQLPDLRQQLIFCGKNGRPDSLPGKESFHIALKGTAEKVLIQEGDKAYLVYQGSYTPKFQATIQEAEGPLWGDVTKGEASEKNPYIFSPGNQPTPLWIEVISGGEQAIEIRVSMLDEKGACINSPAHLSQIQIPLQDYIRSQTPGWELGGHRVDATLLARQKARWIGKDIFLEKHGGSEFSHILGKERVDFLHGTHPYSCFVSVGDWMIWKGGKWEVAQGKEGTHGYPLMLVKKIEEKVISFELWDVEGKGKTLLSLIRARDQAPLPNISQEFKFVGAKTWAQFIVESRAGGRLTLKPHDWLVLTPDGWIKLSSAEQVDAYVEQSLTGPLFILDKLIKKNGRQVLIGHLFNASRTEVEEIELASSPVMPLANFYRTLPVIPPIQPKYAEMEGEDE